MWNTNDGGGQSDYYGYLVPLRLMEIGKLLTRIKEIRLTAGNRLVFLLVDAGECGGERINFATMTHVDKNAGVSFAQNYAQWCSQFNPI